ncbi:MAG: hypothetical protein UV60_C0003G0009 [Parcubacteria group bacterium GW2011_GWA2_43_11]|nr:MAG: hypothetical protein UU89_C0010G0009 [Parcubacteria group bacterium GW2011_GWC2_42_11]KKS86091.1 MAG: hypothetical protein UV60_C0003G0009 [Parcubacteria group bacterium GW2011_GWA2_43_11]
MTLLVSNGIHPLETGHRGPSAILVIVGIFIFHICYCYTLPHGGIKDKLGYTAP